MHLHEVAPAPTEHKEIAGMRIALQRLLHLQVRPFMPRRISVWPVAIHTRTPEGMGIIAAAVPSSPPPPEQDRRPRKYADERRAQTPARSAVWPQATGLELAARFVQVCDRNSCKTYGRWCGWAKTQRLAILFAPAKQHASTDIMPTRNAVDRLTIDKRLSH
jgi:hypothetical protein